MPATAVLFVLVCGIGTLNSVFLAIHLWFHRKGTSVLNRLLAALLFTFSLRVSKAVIVFFVSSAHPLLEFAWIGVLGVTGPVALLYICRLTGTGPRTVRLVLRACALGVLAGLLVFLVLPLGVGWKLMAAALAMYGSSIAVALPTVFAAGKPDHVQDRLAIRWLRAVTAFVTVIWTLHASLLVCRLVGPVAEDTFFDVEAAVFSVAVYALMYAELKSGLLARLHQAGVTEPIPADDPMLKRLRQLMEVERLSLDPSLSLASLAKALKASPQHVSKLINAGIGVSFNDYVNRLRIEEVQRRLSLPDGASRKIGQLGFDCGFNSSSVFYAAFRKFTGKTPSEYLKQLART